MGMDSKIEWTHHTFNPWRGCTKVSPGCAKNYAATMSKRNPGTLGVWGANGTRVVASEATWREPLKWNKAAACQCGGGFNGTHSEYCPQANRPRVFCASLADVFEDWTGPTLDAGSHPLWHVYPPSGAWVSDTGGVADKVRLTMSDARARLFSLIDATPNLDWLLLTKRPENIATVMPKKTRDYLDRQGYKSRVLAPGVRPNVWLGTSVEDGAAKRRIDILRDIPVAVRFLSIEPLLEHLGELDLRGIHWVIVGGESGPGGRPIHPDWVRSIRDQCVAANVPFFFKQWGEWWPGSRHGHDSRCMYADGRLVEFSQEALNEEERRSGKPHDNRTATIVTKIGKKTAGRLLDGREWSELPEVRK